MSYHKGVSEKLITLAFAYNNIAKSNVSSSLVSTATLSSLSTIEEEKETKWEKAKEKPTTKYAHICIVAWL